MYAPSTAADTDRGLRTASWLVAFSAVLYSSWVLEFWLPTHVSRADGFASELFAADQPFRWLFGGADFIAAVGVGLAALICLGRITGPPRGRLWSRIGWLLLLLFAVATVVDVLFPLDCAVSLTNCEKVEDGGGVSVAHHIHQASSTVANLAVVAAMLALEFAARNLGTPTHGLRIGLVFSVLTAAALLATAALAAADMGFPIAGVPHNGQGIPQRLQVALVCVWFAVLAWYLRKTARHE